MKINVENKVLKIRGERKFEQETKNENFLRIERSYVYFYAKLLAPIGS